jgi:hypothetical protein
MPDPQPGRVTRRRALEAFRRLPEGCAITTIGLAFILDCPEHRVRGAVSWLAAGGLVVATGRFPRKDRRGKAYAPRLWSWRGEEEIRKLRRNPVERQMLREGDVQALAAEWLSRRW